MTSIIKMTWIIKIAQIIKMTWIIKIILLTLIILILYAQFYMLKCMQKQDIKSMNLLFN